MKRIKRLLLGALIASAAVPMDAQAPMYGWVQQRSEAGGYTYEMNSITMDETLKFAPLMTLDYTAMANAGVCILDNKLSTMYVNKTNLLLGELTAYYYEYDTNNWQQLLKKSITDPTQVALETAQHMESGTVYGVFYQSNLSMSSFNWGIINYGTMQVTPLGTTTHRIVALGVTHDRMVYGVATDGNLYRFDTSTGVESLVGPTGLVISPTAIQSGEIDQTTDTFYMANTSGTGKSALYTIDLTSSLASKVCDFENNQWISGLTMIPTPIDGGVPASVADLQVNFSGGSTTGVVSFVAPSTLYDGSPLTGELTYYVSANDDMIATGKVQAGKSKTVEVTVPEGVNEISVYVVNTQGDSPKARKSLYVGYDVPEPASDVLLTIESGTATVTWTSPTRGLHDAFMGDLTFDVVRYPQGDTVAHNISANSFTQQLDNENIQIFKYGVIVHNGTQQSAESFSNEQKFGLSGLYEIPIDFTFTSDQYVSELRTVDANGDGKTWSYNVGNRALTSNTTRTLPGDDWVFLPGVNLKAGYTYRISINAKTYLKSYPTRFEAKMGTAAQVASMTIAVLDSTNLPTNQYAWYRAEITVPTDGAYYLGIHDVSDATGFSTHINDVVIDVASAPTSPSAVTSLNITPNKQGELNAQISFMAPSTFTDGSPLEEITRIDILRDGNVIASLENAQPGQQIDAVIDTVDSDGFYTYTVVAYSAGIAGARVEKKVYVGVDIPQAPQNLYAIDHGNSIELRWDMASPKGVNGELVIPEQVYYDVIAGDMITHIDTINTNFIVIDSITTTGVQHIARFYVKSQNRAGRNNYYMPVVLPVGAPFLLPYDESFADGKTTQFCWSEGSGSSRVINPEMSVDADGGSYMIVCTEDGNSGSFNTGKITLKGAINPQLIFSYRNGLPGKNVSLNAVVARPDHSADTLKTVNMDEGNVTDWQLGRVDLSDYVNEEYIVVKLLVASHENERIYTLLDGISVRDVKDVDLAVNASASARATIGENITVSAVVSNRGSQAVESYSLNLYAGDVLVKQLACTQAIQSEQQARHSLEFVSSTTNLQSGETELRVEVVAEQDMEPGNNVDTITLQLHDANASPVENLVWESSVVSWDAPTMPVENRLESFESYPSGLVDNVGQWSFYDADQSESAAITGFKYAHQGEPFAFMTFNPLELGMLDSYPVLSPHYGDQSLMAIVGFKESKMVDADNWLISPELPGVTQNLSFWVRNTNLTETFEVLYSKASADISDFQVFKNGSVSTKEWERVEVELPEGTKYFAIRHTTEAANALVFLLDDVQFTQLAGKPVSYRVYCDGSLVDDVIDTRFSLGGQTPEGTHRIDVTAVYASGAESAPRTVLITMNKRGDVNLDGRVDVADVNAAINIILKLSTDSAMAVRADLDGDGKVDVADINAIINIILKMQ